MLWGHASLLLAAVFLLYAFPSFLMLLQPHVEGRGAEPDWQEHYLSGIFNSFPIRDVRFVGLILSSFFTFFATALSFWLIYDHLRRNTILLIRRPTLRILLMVPIYSLQAFTAMHLRVSHTTDHVFKFFREAYESLVIFSFLQFILACIGGADAMVRVLSSQRQA